MRAYLRAFLRARVKACVLAGAHSCARIFMGISVRA